MSVHDLLLQAGLAQLIPAFEDISMDRFKTLRLMDYEKHGVCSLADKQALFKLIQDLNAEDLQMSLTLSPAQSSSTESQTLSSPDPAPRHIDAYNAITSARTPAAPQQQYQQHPVDFDPTVLDDPGEDALLDLDASASDDDDFLADDDEDVAAFSEAFLRSATPENGRYSNNRSNVNAQAGHMASNMAGTQGYGSSATGNTAMPRYMGDQPGGTSHVQPAMQAAGAAGCQFGGGGGGGYAAMASQPAEQLAPADVARLAALADPPRIRVIVRKRPLNKKEAERGETDVLECEQETSTLYVHEPKIKVDLTKFTECHAFRFDDVFDEKVGNEELYCRAVQPLIATFFRRGRGTCFAYGQTGSGKTYTMQPLPLRAAADILRVMESIPDFAPLSLHVSCYEIYGGKIFDLLNSRERLEVREDGKKQVRVVGLKEIQVASVETLSKLCNHAACARSTGATGANDESSRSHSILTFVLRAPAPRESGTGDENGSISTRGRLPPRQRDAPVPLKIIGKLSFIDLAGSERGADTFENDKQTRLEGAEINKSLLALKECIRALDMAAGHIPFRGSKLTSVLRDSFLGKNARTVMIANVSPNSHSCEHTLNTLRYADRVKEMKKEGASQKDLPGAGAGAGAGAGGANSGHATVAAPHEVNEVAALLQQLPPPSFSDQEQQQQVSPPSPQALHHNHQAAHPASEHGGAASGLALPPPPQAQQAAQAVGTNGNHPSQYQQQQQRGSMMVGNKTTVATNSRLHQGIAERPSVPTSEQLSQVGTQHQQALRRGSARQPPQMLSPSKLRIAQQQQHNHASAMPGGVPSPTKAAVAPSSSSIRSSRQERPMPLRREARPPTATTAAPPGSYNATAAAAGGGGGGGSANGTAPHSLDHKNSHAQQHNPIINTKNIEHRFTEPGLAAHPISASVSQSNSQNSPTSASSASIINASVTVPGSNKLGGRGASESEAELLAAEDELIFAHKQHIEETMAAIRSEMELLARLDDSTGAGLSLDGYLEELNHALVDRSASIATLQQQVALFRRKLRAAAVAYSELRG